MKEFFKKDAVERFVEGSDVFAEKVLHRVDGDDKLGTKCGGITTILIKIWLFAMLVWYIIVI